MFEPKLMDFLAIFDWRKGHLLLEHGGGVINSKKLLHIASNVGGY